MSHQLKESIMRIQFKADSVTVSSDVHASMEDMMMFAEKHHTEAQAKYPSDWQYVMVDENYGGFFLDGSPQIDELGWTMEYKLTSSGCSLTISGLS
jgi:hypothetical protein